MAMTGIDPAPGKLKPGCLRIYSADYPTLVVRSRALKGSGRSTTTAMVSIAGASPKRSPMIPKTIGPVIEAALAIE